MHFGKKKEGKNKPRVSLHEKSAKPPGSFLSCKISHIYITLGKSSFLGCIEFFTGVKQPSMKNFLSHDYINYVFSFGITVDKLAE